jgi:lysyl-tRNA synthetase class 1
LEGSAPKTHWADRIAREVIAAGRAPVISTGISPSGEIHVGNLREVLTGDAIHRALLDLGASPRFHFVSDDLDPLRRVYPFLDPSVYGPLVGRPLSGTRCPCGRHPSYAEHFLEPFLASLRELRIAVDVVRAHELYASGRMTECILEALVARDEIASILLDLTGKEVEAGWSPFQPLCPACGRISQARVTAFDAKEKTVGYACACGDAGTVPMAGGGKLTWRVDWPARWKVLGVTVEPFGKDHATRGGSYDTGARIAREVFGVEPPFPIPYEWIRLKGGGDMSSSKGNVLSIARALELVPPEVLRYLVLKEQPQRTIAFDPGLPLLKLIDEVDDATAEGKDDRSLALSRAGGFHPVGVPFKHLVVAAQTARFDENATLEVLSRTGYRHASREAVGARMRYARRWLEAYAPEDLKFEVQATLPAEAASLTADQRGFLASLAGRLEDGMSGDEIHALIYAVASAFPGSQPAELFRAIYLTLLGKPRGPRAGWFVALLGPRKSASRFTEASRAAHERRTETEVPE